MPRLSSVTLMAAACLTALCSAGQAQTLRDGTYSGGSDTYVLSATLQGWTAYISVSTAGCIGEISGSLQKNSAGQLLLVPDDFDLTQCAIGLFPDSDTSFQTMELPECFPYHGAACNFEGTFALQQ